MGCWKLQSHQLNQWGLIIYFTRLKRITLNRNSIKSKMVSFKKILSSESHWMIIQYQCSLHPGDWVCMKMPSYQYRKSHCGDKTIFWTYYYNCFIHTIGFLILVMIFKMNQGPAQLTSHYQQQWYCQTSNISRTLVGNKMVDHSAVVGASPVGAAPTTSSFST